MAIAIAKNKATLSNAKTRIEEGKTKFQLVRATTESSSETLKPAFWIVVFINDDSSITIETKH